MKNLVIRQHKEGGVIAADREIKKREEADHVIETKGELDGVDPEKEGEAVPVIGEGAVDQENVAEDQEIHVVVDQEIVKGEEGRVAGLMIEINEGIEEVDREREPIMIGTVADQEVKKKKRKRKKKMAAIVNRMVTKRERVVTMLL